MRSSMKVAVAAIVGALALQSFALASIPDTSGSGAEGGALSGTEWGSTIKQTEYSNGKFKGKVVSAFALEEHHTTDSEIAICEEGRTVELYRTFVKKTKSGKKTVTALIDSKPTNASGAYAITAEKKSGTYKAVVLKSEVAYFDYYGDTGEDMVAICLGDKATY